MNSLPSAPIPGNMIQQTILLSSSPHNVPSPQQTMYLSHAKKRAIALVQLMRRRKRAARKKRLWVHETLRSREQFGEFRLAKELRFHSNRFRVYFRLSREQFDSLLGRVGPRI
ncbi:unnamed protein product [Leuciscus chuanchicus]